MKILLYGRLEGGMKTHVNDLARILSRKHKVEVISQENLSSIRLVSGSYYIDKPSSFNILKEKIKDNDVVHMHQPATSSEIPLRWSKLDAKMINTFHISLGYGFYSITAKLITKMSARWFRKKSSYYIAIGRNLKKILERYNKTVLINNGIDTEKFKPKKVGRYFNDVTVGYLGRLDFYKNVELLVKACKELNVNLAIAGKGVLYEKFKKYESKSIKVCGFLKDAEVFYNKIDIFASPSLIEGNVCRTALEAMSCKKPVILSSCGGEEDEIKQSFGMITKPDVKSIKESIKKILKKDIKKMGKEARRVTMKKFDVRVMVNKTEKIYKKALEEL